MIYKELFEQIYIELDIVLGNSKKEKNYFFILQKCKIILTTF